MGGVNYTIDRWTDTLKIIRYSGCRGMRVIGGLFLGKGYALGNVEYGFID